MRGDVEVGPTRGRADGSRGRAKATPKKDVGMSVSEEEKKRNWAAPDE